MKWLHPLCTDTAFSQRLLSRRFFRVAQIRKEHHRLAISRSTMTFPQRIGSNRGTTRLLQCFHTTEVTFRDWYTNPATTIGLLREASVALQGLLISLTDLSDARERDSLVLQHKQPHSAFGQAHLQASGATESHRSGRLTPLLFSLVSNQAFSGDKPQLSDVSSDRLSAPLLYGLPRPTFSTC